MSTKLYDGLRLKDPQSSIFDVVAEISRVINEVREAESVKLVSEAVIAAYDSEVLRKDHPNKMLWRVAEEKWEKEQVAFGEHHTLNDPLRFSIVFGKSKRGQILAYPFSMLPSYQDALMGTGLFEDYHYQNNSDRPEELNETEWEERRTEWDSVLDERGTFSSLPTWVAPDTKKPFLEGLMFASGDDAQLVEEKMNGFLTPAARARRMLLEAVMKRVFTRLKDEWADDVVYLGNRVFSFMAEKNRSLRNVEGGILRGLKSYPVNVTKDDMVSSMKDLPPLYVPDEEVVEGFVEEFLREYGFVEKG